MTVNNTNQVINYLNCKSVNGGQIRTEDKITDMSFYCHGLSEKYSPHTDYNHLSFAYDCTDSENVIKKYEFTQQDITRLNAQAFDHTTTYFYSCNSGTKDSTGKSFAQEWTNVTGGKTRALVNGRTYYGAINCTGNWFVYTGVLGQFGFTPSDVINKAYEKFGYDTSDEWQEKMKRKRDRETNGKGYSDYGSLNYPYIVTWAGDLNVLYKGGAFSRGWEWFEPECEE